MKLFMLALIAQAALIAAEPLSPAESKELDAVIAAVVKAGFPDGKTWTLYRGELKVRATSGPKGEDPLLPCDASSMQETSDSGVAYLFTFPGLHAKSPQGAWLIACGYAYTPRPTDTVDVDRLQALNPAELTATAVAERPFDAEKQAAEYLAPLSATDRPRLVAAMNRFVPVSYLLKIRPDDWAPAAVLLHRAGWSDTGMVGLTIADQRARSFWQLRPWTEPDIAFDPTGAYATSEAEERAWSEAHKILSLEPPATAVRRALFRFCKAQLSRDDPVLAPDVALACALACLDPQDPQGHGERLKALRASRNLPPEVAADAPLLARLQSWGAPQRPRMVVRNGGGAKGNVGISTSFAAPNPTYTPAEQDLDALVALLGDGRPSRWVDFAGARSVGDNAWRALATILKQDPRVLAGLPTDKPWTTAERTAAATAFQAWWKKHRTDKR